MPWIVRLVRDVKAIKISQCIHVKLLIQTIYKLTFKSNLYTLNFLICWVLWCNDLSNNILIRPPPKPQAFSWDKLHWWLFSLMQFPYGISMVWCTHFLSKLKAHIISKVVTHKISLTLNSFRNCIELI
jgi:hypothetical protein